MNRFFTDNIIAGQSARISGEDVRHISKVLRLRIGDSVCLCDGAGTEYLAKIAEIGKDSVLCSVDGGKPSTTESKHRVTLFQGVPKSSKMEVIIQKCVELGVHSIQPVWMSRCVPSSSREDENRIKRYQRVSLEAAKQSCRGIIPDVLPPRRLREIDFSGYDRLIVAYEMEKATTLKEVLKNTEGEKIGIVIGPEGGLEAGEVRFLNEAGGKTVTLGERILRTETAGMAMLAQILYELEG